MVEGGTGVHIVNEEWVKLSTLSEFPLNNDVYKGSFLENSNTGYKYMWYSTPNNNGGLDYFAGGKYAQFLYISPENNLCSVQRVNRLEGHSWQDILKEVSSEVGKNGQSNTEP